MSGELPGNGLSVEQCLTNVDSRPGARVGLSTPRQNAGFGFLGYKQRVTREVARPAQSEAMIGENFSIRVDQRTHRTSKLGIKAEIF
jgi:hypothetical protein